MARDSIEGKTAAVLRGRIGIAAIVSFALVSPAAATTGYFEHGYGVQSEGLGGVSIAYPKDSLAIATNPATLSALGDSLDLGAELFVPKRGAEFSHTTGGLGLFDGSFSGNGKSSFVIPQFGYTHRLNSQWSVGIAVYGNGGMNTSYEKNPYFGSSGTAGVNLSQLFAAPTLSYEFAPGHTIGASAKLVDQFFEARGLGLFSLYSSSPSALSDNGKDSAYGIGGSIGYYGQWTPDFSVGAFWQSKVYSQRFQKYEGLFAGHGAFDIPSTYGIGLAYKIFPDLDIAADLTRIEYADVDSVANSVAELFTYGHALGSSNGPGFGWRNVTVIKAGVNYRIDPEWQVRAGWAYSTQPVPSDQTLLNVLAPGVVQHHFTAGATWSTPLGFDISSFALYAPRTEVTGTGVIPAAFGGGDVKVHLSEFSLGLALGWKFAD